MRIAEIRRAERREDPTFARDLPDQPRASLKPRRKPTNRADITKRNLEGAENPSIIAADT